MVTIKLDDYTAADVEAINALRELGLSDELIQEYYDMSKQNEKGGEGV